MQQATQLKIFNLIILITLFLKSTPLLSQPSIPSNQIDSIFKSVQTSNGDWAISITIMRAGTIPIYDSLGNEAYDFSNGTILFLKIGKNYFCQRIEYKYLTGKIERTTIIGKRLKLPSNLEINYTVDSLVLADSEWIYPFIYKNDSTNTYTVQSPANHAAYYAMYFKTQERESFVRYFTETDIEEGLPFFQLKNINYNYNSKTFILRAFYKLHQLIYQIKP